MARSKYVTGGIVASIIWLIIGTAGLVFRNSDEARYANIAARTSCRAAANFSDCIDAYYASIGGAPGIDWVRIGGVLVAGLVVIWMIVLILKAVRGNKGAADE